MPEFSPDAISTKILVLCHLFSCFRGGLFDHNICNHRQVIRYRMCQLAINDVCFIADQSLRGKEEDMIDSASLWMGWKLLCWSQMDEFLLTLQHILQRILINFGVEIPPIRIRGRPGIRTCLSTSPPKTRLICFERVNFAASTTSSQTNSPPVRPPASSGANS